MPFTFVEAVLVFFLKLHFLSPAVSLVFPGLLTLFSTSVRSVSLPSLSSQWGSQMCLSLLPFSLIFITYLYLISSTEHKFNYPLNTDDLQISFSAQDLSFKIFAEYHCCTKVSLAAILLILFVSSSLHQTLTLSPEISSWGSISPFFSQSVWCLLAPTSSWFWYHSATFIYYWLHRLQFNFARN